MFDHAAPVHCRGRSRSVSASSHSSTLTEKKWSLNSNLWSEEASALQKSEHLQHFKALRYNTLTPGGAVSKPKPVCVHFLTNSCFFRPSEELLLWLNPVFSASPLVLINEGGFNLKTIFWQTFVILFCPEMPNKLRLKGSCLFYCLWWIRLFENKETNLNHLNISAVCAEQTDLKVDWYKLEEEIFTKSFMWFYSNWGVCCLVVWENVGNSGVSSLLIGSWAKFD